MPDWRLLAWLRWRQWRGSALYWLRTVGYDPNQRSLIDRMYALYLLGLGLIWVLVMGAWAFSQAASIGAHFTAPLVDAALAYGVPWLVLGLAVVAMALHARSAPLKLSFADMAYVAGSPVSRRAAVLVNYVQEVIQVTVLLVPILALVVAALAQPLGQETARGAAGRVAVVVVPLVALALAVAWCLGLLYLAAPRLKHFPLAWLLPVLLLAGGYLLPGVFLWPGRTLAAAIPGPVPAASVIALAVLAALAIAVLARIGRRTNMVDVADESAVFARINALGLMAWLAPDVAQRIRRQAALARRKPFLRLPSLPGPAGLVARSALTYLRRPLSLFGLAAWGFAAALAGSGLVFRGAGILLWLFGLTVLLLIPPPGLVDAFRSDLPRAVSPPVFARQQPVAPRCRRCAVAATRRTRRPHRMAAPAGRDGRRRPGCAADRRHGRRACTRSGRRPGRPLLGQARPLHRVGRLQHRRHRDRGSRYCQPRHCHDHRLLRRPGPGPVHCREPGDRRGTVITMTGSG